jgi:nickel-dependent lactate racemase
LVEVWLPYGNTEVSVRIPTKNILEMIEPNEISAINNPQAEIEKKLLNPTGSNCLSEIAKPGEKVSLVLQDAGISTNHMMVSAIFKELVSAGVREGDITLIVAYNPLLMSSVHKETTILGDMLSSRIRIIRHNNRTSQSINVGKTSRGTDVYLNKEFFEADVKILAGVVEPHPFSGYSGGREGVIPGVSSFETNSSLLKLSLNSKVERGIIEGNPVHEEMNEAIDLAKVDFALNIVRNIGLDIVEATSGDAIKSFNKAVQVAKKIYEAGVEKRADIVFISSGGSPFDNNLFEGCQILDVANKIVKRNKIVVLVSECVNGHGNRDFYDAISRFKDPKKMRKNLKKNFSVGLLIAHRLMTLLQSMEVVLVSVMPDYYTSKIGLKSTRTANEAFRYASDVIKNGKVSLIPYGNLTVPLKNTL